MWSVCDQLAGWERTPATAIYYQSSEWKSEKGRESEKVLFPCVKVGKKWGRTKD